MEVEEQEVIFTAKGKFEGARDCIYKRVRKISFVMSVRTSVCPHGRTRFPLDRFRLNLIFETFSKICAEHFKFH